MLNHTIADEWDAPYELGSPEQPLSRRCLVGVTDASQSLPDASVLTELR